MNFLKKIDINYVSTLLFLIISANASFLSSSDLWWFSVLAFLIIVALAKKALLSNDLKVISLFSLIYLLFVAVRDLLINSLDAQFLISDIIFLFKFIYLSFVFCSILKEKTIAYLVKVIVHLTILSFFFYAIQMVAGDAMFKLFTSLSPPTLEAIPGYSNLVLFTFTQGFHDFSNSGFVWEPGSFGCFLIIALLLNFFLNKFTFDKKSIVLIVGIVTTFSTTDYLALLIVFFLAYRYRVQKFNFWSIALVLVGAALIFTVPLLGGKISDTYYEDMDDLNRLKTLEIFYRHLHMQIPLNRFSSMVYIYNTYGWSLILGISNKYEVILNKAYSINISNGIFDFLAKFGLVGLGFLFYKYSRFCFAFVARFEYVIYCVIILLTIGFGEPVLVLPITLTFIFLSPKQVSLIIPQSTDKKKRRPAYGIQ